MNTKRNVITTIAAIMTIMFIVMIINITINLRDFGISSAKTKAQLVAQSVKNGLTAHMVNGMMENRDFFINQTKQLSNIDDLWITRAATVEKQYGLGKEPIRDDIDAKVLKTGNIIDVVDENFFGHSTYRITIPYKSEINSNINCISCHDSKVGDTLGAISMIMTMDDLKDTSLKIIFYVSSISLILSLIILIFVKNIITPYLSIFESIKNVMKKAKDGDYSGRIGDVNNAESKEVAHWIDEHMNKLQTNLISMEEKIDIFLTAHKSENVIDPIIDVENTVTRLSDIYKFKKVIEHDEIIEDVYIRFAVVLKEKFNINNFNFIEADTTNKTINIVYKTEEILCDPILNGCRADRINTIVDSTNFKDVCPHFKSDKHHLCVPYSISNDLDFIINIISHTQEEHENARDQLPFIQDYVDTAKPEIVSKKLMQILEKNANTDPLTGLFNRKYLENFIEKTLYKGELKNIPCGLMMVDIDFFKLINDNYGHDIGDIAIKTISNTLTDVISNDDIAIRFGGEEFIVILTNATEEKLLSVAQEIRIAFSQQKIQAGTEIFSKTVSIGTSLFPNTNEQFWKYIKQCDIALYEAKQTGRDKVVRYTQSMEQ
ncbi:MAG: GGDEF domain-containing protein [Campylobacterota bacterium]|nr:GGDEF domain-containing protein [Campylobacterota bacterium]